MIKLPGSEGVVLTAEEKANEESGDCFAAANAKFSDLRLRVIFSIDRLEGRNGNLAPCDKGAYARRLEIPPLK